MERVIMILVKLNCAHCNKLMGSLDEAQVRARTRSHHSVRRCRCDMPTPERFVDVLISRDLPSMSVTLDVPWDQILPAVDRARATGKTQRILVPRI